MSFCGICGYDIVVCDCWNDDDEPTCDHCDGSGRVPSTEMDAAEGFMYVACQHCEAGLQWPARS